MHMKLVFKNLICIILFSSLVGSCQVLDSLLAYYPLNEGDYWEYIEEQIDPVFNKYSRTEYYQKVIGDTTLLDSHVYKVIEKCNINENNIEYIFERIDTLTASIYRFVDVDGVWPKQRLIDSLNSPLYNSFSGFSRYSSSPATISLQRISSDTLFNKPVTTLHFIARDLIWDFEYSFAQHIGLISARAITPEATCTYTWRLKVAKVEGIEYDLENGVNSFTTKMLPDFILQQNYPNPFNLNTIIEYDLLIPGSVEFILYNVLGQKVKTISEIQSCGSHKIVLSASGLSSGVYFYEIKTRSFSIRKKLLVLQ
ncbi:MAG TPA: T9SS type A sorting domain-containing protein [bacterium]|nr:T9SS type A sorting domain-containing protein [bacterium]HPG44320.1 T9SS type A sorting domain-containing protein [bacterium]HPM96687.1 T9SS type A sorting domain-containing protein [bacterium]